MQSMGHNFLRVLVFNASTLLSTNVNHQNNYNKVYMPGLMSDNMKPEKGVFYARINNNELEYRVMPPEGEEVTDKIKRDELEKALEGKELSQLMGQDFKPENLSPFLSKILAITSRKSHTRCWDVSTSLDMIAGGEKTVGLLKQVQSLGTKIALIKNAWDDKDDGLRLEKEQVYSGVLTLPNNNEVTITQYRLGNNLEEENNVNEAQATGFKAVHATDEKTLQQNIKKTIEQRQAAFFQAVKEGKYGEVEKLINQGVNHNQYDPEGNTPLLLAIKMGHNDV